MQRPANKDPEVQLAIEMTSLCRQLNCLPGAGGLLDQDGYHVWLLQNTLAVFDEAERREHEKAKAQARASRGRR